MTNWPSFTPDDEADAQRRDVFAAQRAELDEALHDALLEILRALKREAATPSDGGDRLTHLARAFSTIQGGDYVMYSDGRPGFEVGNRDVESGWFMYRPDDEPPNNPNPEG